MLDINLLRNDPEKVRENIRKKFQDQKLPMVDEVIRFDREYRDAQQQADALRNRRKVVSKEIGALMGKGEKEEAEKRKAEVAAMAEELAALEVKEEELKAEIRKRMLVIPNIIDDSVPIGKDDSENVEIERFGEPAVPDFEIPYQPGGLFRYMDHPQKAEGIWKAWKDAIGCKKTGRFSMSTARDIAAPAGTWFFSWPPAGRRRSVFPSARK